MPVFQAVMGGAGGLGVQSLSDRAKMRWIAATQDYLREVTRSGAQVVGVQLLDGAGLELGSEYGLAAAHPVEDAFDGHALTYLEAAAVAHSVKITVDTLTDARKDFVVLGYPYGKLCELLSVEWGGAADGVFGSATGSLTLLNQGLKQAVYRMPVEGVLEDSDGFAVTVVTGKLQCQVSPLSDPDGYWIGARLKATSGPNQNVERIVVGYNYVSGSDAQFIFDAPFPQLLTAGTTMTVYKYGQNYLSSRYMKLRIGRGSQAAGYEAIQLTEVGACGFLFEFRGDEAQQFSDYPPNPAQRTRTHRSGLVRRKLLNGGVYVQSVGSPTEDAEISWEYCGAQLAALFEELAQRERFTLIDHQGAARQGYLQTDGLAFDDLPRAIGREEEIAVRATFVGV